MKAVQSRSSPFRIGLFTGLALAGLVGVVGWAVTRLSPRSEFNVEIIGVGADLDVHRTTRITLAHARGPVFTQVCNGGCDDLRLREDMPKSDFTVQVLGPSGAQPICVRQGYVAGGGYLSNTVRWTLGGREKLSCDTLAIGQPATP